MLSSIRTVIDQSVTQLSILRIQIGNMHDNVHVCTVPIDSSYKRKDKDICYHRKKLIILSSLHVLSYGNIYSKYHTKLPFGGNKYRKTLNVRGIISEDIF